ncbi:MAG: 5-methylcytosine-specific restriction endonuclease system specificity protein McrC [Selenomonas sp.]|nr:5-methylcytosine-specific restriction endonuclease system specificity protein McrC [Selenomonas sp.]
MIPVRNIYYMLSYAFRVLQLKEYRQLATESFEKAEDLYAAILIKGVSTQLRRGLHRDYEDKREPLTCLHGKLEITESLIQNCMQRKQIVCTYDDFSVNTQMNQILKLTMRMLLYTDISTLRKKSLRRLWLYFSDIDDIDAHNIQWKQHYQRNNQTYQMLLGICYLVLNSLLQNQQSGQKRFMDFMDDQKMCRLYEKFILEYYRKEHPELSAVAAQIPWVVDDSDLTGLPIMQSDICLSYNNRYLIIDAKHYTNIMQQHFGMNSMRSAHLYQIFTYVKNKEASLAGQNHKVSGMLLYAGTNDAVQPHHTYSMSGNDIHIQTLDLNRDFSNIRASLDSICHSILLEG